MSQYNIKRIKPDFNKLCFEEWISIAYWYKATNIQIHAQSTNWLPVGMDTTVWIDASEKVKDKSGVN